MHYTINRNVINNYFIFDLVSDTGLTSIIPVYLTRYFSPIRAAHFTLVRTQPNNPEYLALEHINSGEPTTSTIINKILSNQNIIVTDLKLKELLKVKGVEIDLPITTPKNNKLLENLTGKSKYKGFFGVYMFIHKNTAQKYVGSSNLLRRRMDYYFKGEFTTSLFKVKEAGKFVPFLKKEGLKAFKLIIFKLDTNKFSIQDALILEQYFLLNKEFNLNTLRVVNAGSSKGDAVFVYDLTCKTLYYHAKSKIELKRVLKIHTETSKKYVDSKIPYLNKFLLLSYSIPTASISNIPIEELVEIMQKERQSLYILGTRRNIPVKLEIKEGNTFVEPRSTAPSDAATLNFDSLTSCIEYLRVLGLTIKRDTLTKYIKNGKVFHNFLCKYSDKALPNNFEEVGLIIDEYKKAAAAQKIVPQSSNDSLKVNKKNKPILVRGQNFEKEFESIMVTVKYFYTLNIKLDRNTLNNRLKDGKIYKDYYFAYK